MPVLYTAYHPMANYMGVGYIMDVIVICVLIFFAGFLFGKKSAKKKHLLVIVIILQFRKLFINQNRMCHPKNSEIPDGKIAMNCSGI